jgi:hypothetical protein
MITWRFEAFEGVGKLTQPQCAIPNCCRETDNHGLCMTCYRLFLRKGMPGLLRRARRLKYGVPFRFKVPLEMEPALEVLSKVYEARIDASEDENEYNRLTGQLIKVCRSIADLSKKAEWRRQQRRWRRNFIRQYGIVAFRKRQSEAAVAYRLRKKNKGLERRQQNGHDTWINPNES